MCKLDTDCHKVPLSMQTDLKNEKLGNFDIQYTILDDSEATGFTVHSK